MHTEPHPMAGQIVQANPVAPLFGHTTADPFDFYVEDWQDRVYGTSWMNAEGNPAALGYAARSAAAHLPLDNEVVYGRDPRGLAHLLHVSELAQPAAATEGKTQQ